MKRYDYVGAVYGGVQRDIDGNDLNQSVKRVLRKLVRESVSKALRDRTGDTIVQCDEAADRVAKEMVP